VALLGRVRIMRKVKAPVVLMRYISTRGHSLNKVPSASQPSGPLGHILLPG